MTLHWEYNRVYINSNMTNNIRARLKMWSEKTQCTGYCWDVVWDIILEIIWDRLWDIIWDAPTKCVGLVWEWEMIRQIWPCHVHSVFVGPFVVHVQRSPWSWPLPAIPQWVQWPFRPSSPAQRPFPGWRSLLPPAHDRYRTAPEAPGWPDWIILEADKVMLIISSCPIVTYLTLSCLILSSYLSHLFSSNLQYSNRLSSNLL